MIVSWQSFSFGIRKTEFDEGPDCEYLFAFKFEKPKLEIEMWLYDKRSMEKVRDRLLKLLKGKSNVCRLIGHGGDLTATFRRNQETNKIDLVLKYDETHPGIDGDLYTWNRSLKVNIKKIPLSTILCATRI